MSDTNNKKSKRSKTSKDRLIQRMVNAYRKSKRKKKIEKLLGDDDHWSGLS